MLIGRDGLSPRPARELAAYLRAYADKQLTVVLTPRLMQLRRLVIGEVGRFPDLARVLYERGPQRAMTKLAAMFERLAARGLLTLDDPHGGGVALQLADHGRPAESRDAARGPGHPRAGCSSTPRRRGRAGVPRRLRSAPGRQTESNTVQAAIVVTSYAEIKGSEVRIGRSPSCACATSSRSNGSR